MGQRDPARLIQRALGPVKGHGDPHGANVGQLTFRMPPQSGDQQIVSLEEVEIRLPESEIRHDALIIIAEYPLTIDALYMGEGSFAGQNLHMADVYALLLQRGAHLFSKIIRAHRAQIGGLAAQTPYIHRNIDRISAGKALADVVIIIHTVVACARNFYHNNSFALCSASPAAPVGSSI